ncbi:hypothetical protein [Microbulbifer taiwanensis]|uniref:hypothetical protein n=1 Tax=Microbulbifer taiwanensis TaxID=986746 RepID=UPI00360B50D9
MLDDIAGGGVEAAGGVHLDDDQLRTPLLRLFCRTHQVIGGGWAYGTLNRKQGYMRANLLLTAGKKRHPRQNQERGGFGDARVKASRSPIQHGIYPGCRVNKIRLSEIT